MTFQGLFKIIYAFNRFITIALNNIFLYSIGLADWSREKKIYEREDFDFEVNWGALDKGA